MQLARLDVTPAEMADLASVAAQDHPLVIRVIGADTVTMLAAMSEALSGAWGVWLEASEHYSAGLIARDVKTLARLLWIEHVVVDAAENSAAHAEVVRVLLSNESVTLYNAVANITGAYNRPAPPRPVTVWNVQGDLLVHPQRSLLRQRVSGALTYYQD